MNQTNPAKPTKHIAIAIDLDKAVPWHDGCCEGILHDARAQGWSALRQITRLASCNTSSA